jgi:predicted 2-oxoglutarate/Fe(II)-dependent dioxygenase YbiX
MKVTEHHMPRSYLVIDDLFSEETLDLFMNDTRKFLTDFKPGLYFTDGKEQLKTDIKQNKVFNYTNMPDRSQSEVCKVLDKLIWSDEMRKVYDNTACPIFSTLNTTSADDVQLTRYDAGDFYNMHIDGLGLVTICIFLCSNPQKFTGGDFLVKFNGESKVIPFKRGRMILFPTNLPHSVTPIQTDSTDPADSRYSIQIWSW